MIRHGLLLCCCLAAGCRDASPPPAASAFPGPEGEAVVVQSLPVERIASIMQSATEWLVLMGEADRLVARTDYDRQAILADRPSLGGGLEVSAEAIAALDPDVVLGWRNRPSADLARALAPFNIPVIAVEVTDTAEVYRQLAVLGVLTGAADTAAALADRLRHELEEARAASCPAGREPESAFVVLSTEPPYTTGAGTWMTELLGAACLRNVFDDLNQPWPQVSIEAMVSRQPRWIITSRGARPGARQQEMLERVGWRDLDAVREGRIIELDGDLFARAGPTMAEWVRAVIAERQVKGEG